MKTTRKNGLGGYMGRSIGLNLSDKKISQLLNWWADQTLRMDERSALGYPSQTAEARAMIYRGRVDSRPPTSIVPDIPMSWDFRLIDRIMRALEGETKEVAFWHYLGPGNTGDKVRAFCEKNEGIGKAKYYAILGRVYECVRVGIRLDERGRTGPKMNVRV